MTASQPQPAWVLLRGLMRERRHWGGFPALLQAVSPGAPIALLDLPGNGSRHAMASPASIAALVEFCRRQLRAEGLAPPYRLCALSLGGMAAAAWCLAYPDEIAGAVLINTSMRPFSPFYRRLRWSNYGRLAGLLMKRKMEAREAALLRLCSNRTDRTAALADWVACQRDCPVTRANALRQLLAAARYRAAPGRPAAPVLLLASAGDRLVDPRCSRELAAAWGSVLRLHPWAGHDLPLDDGGWVAQNVAAWLAGLSPAPPA